MSSMSITIAADGVSQQRVMDMTTTGFDLFGDDRTIVAVRVNGELRDLNRILPKGAMVEPVSINSPDGLNILRHSTAHVDQGVDRPADHRRVLLRLRRGGTVHA